MHFVSQVLFIIHTLKGYTKNQVKVDHLEELGFFSVLMVYGMFTLQSDVNAVCFADEAGHVLYSGSDDHLCKVNSSSFVICMYVCAYLS